MYVFNSFVSFLVLFLSFTAHAADSDKSVAQVLTAEGKVTAYTDNASPRRELSRGNEIFEGEWLEVAPGARADVRVADGSVVSFLEKTKYQFTQVDSDPNNPKNYKNIANLTEGGLRVISGQLAKLNPEGYSLKTPVATIGIRGTEFIVSMPTKNTVNVSVSNGMVAVRQQNASFITNGFASKISKELVTTLKAGQALQATPRTATHIKQENVFGYGGLQPRMLDTQDVAPITTKPSYNAPKQEKSGPVSPQGSVPATKPAAAKPAADSKSCQAA